jgi:hypothetical protein
MLTLTTPVSVPNIQKVHVDAVLLDGLNNVATVTCSVQGSGGIVYSVVNLQIRDASVGLSQGIRATVAPLGYADRVEVFSTSSATAFTDLVTAYTGAIVARNKAAESALLAAGLLPAGTVA